MRTTGLWHAELVELIVSMRHHDTLAIVDAGFPVPDHVTVIDLGWCRRQPRFLPVLKAVLAELVVERATIASEIADDQLLSGLHTALQGVPVARITHDALKESCTAARGVVRTGEDTPFANVVLHAGVPFGDPS